MLCGMDWWTFGGADASDSPTWFGLPHARLKVVVLQPTVVSRFGCFVFEFWVLRFRDLGAPFSRFGCSVFEVWVLRFRDLGALCFGLRFRNYRCWRLFFRAVSHQLYGNPNSHRNIRAAGIQFLRNNPERFIESNLEQSWIQYLNKKYVKSRYLG